MKELSLETLISVFTEMMGIWFYVLLVVMVIGLVAIVAVVIKDGKIGAARAIRSELAAPVGGAFGIWVALTVTQSKLSDIGGPIDWVMFAVIFIVGAIGGTVVAYVGQGLLERRKTPAVGE